MLYERIPDFLLIMLCLLPIVCINGCGPKEQAVSSGKESSQPQRYGMVIGLKPEKIEYYKKLHAAPWPGVLQQITRSHIHNFSIRLVELKPGEYYLFGYFEYTGDDFEKDMKAMAEDAETIRWWKETDPCQYPIETAKQGDKWTMMEEVFYHP